MDGTSKDRFVGGRLFRPASLTQAQNEYVDIIYKLAKSEYIITNQEDKEGVKFTALQDISSKRVVYLRSEDFDRCIVVVKAVGSFPIFPSEPKSDIYGRIKANISLIFSDRNSY